VETPQPQVPLNVSNLQPVAPGQFQPVIPFSIATIPDGKTTPSDSTDSDSAELLKFTQEQSSSLYHKPTSCPISESAPQTPSAVENSQHPGPVPKAALSALGFPVSVFSLPTAPPGLQVPCKPVTTPAAFSKPVSSSVPEESKQTDHLPKVALSAPGLPVSLSGLPTAPPGHRVPWKPVPTDTDIVTNPPGHSSGSVTDSIGLPISPPNLPVQSGSILPIVSHSSRQTEDTNEQTGKFSWSQIVRGSSADVPADHYKNVHNDQNVTGENLTNQKIRSESFQELDKDFSVLESSASSTMSKRQRNPSSESTSGQSPADVQEGKLFIRHYAHYTGKFTPLLLSILSGQNHYYRYSVRTDCDFCHQGRDIDQNIKDCRKLMT
jgi:hypothetical protein